MLERRTLLLLLDIVSDKSFTSVIKYKTEIIRSPVPHWVAGEVSHRTLYVQRFAIILNITSVFLLQSAVIKVKGAVCIWTFFINYQTTHKCWIR